MYRLPRRPHGAFDLDAAELEQRYKGLQRRLHPDKFSSHSALEKEYADQQVRRNTASVSYAISLGQVVGALRPRKGAQFLLSLCCCFAKPACVSMCDLL